MLYQKYFDVAPFQSQSILHYELRYGSVCVCVCVCVCACACGALQSRFVNRGGLTALGLMAHLTHSAEA